MRLSNINAAGSRVLGIPVTQTNFLNADAMETSIVGAKGQVVIPQKIRALFQIKQGTRVHFEARHGELVLLLRLQFDSACWPRSLSLRIPPQRQRPRGSTPLTPRYFEGMAGCLGTGGKALKVLLAEKKKERAL